MKWTKTADALPKKEGDYLCCVRVTECILSYYVAHFAFSLEKYDKHDFYGEDEPGFVKLDSEWGFYNAEPFAWTEFKECDIETEQKRIF